MPIENWLAFTAAATIMLAIPGPTVLLIVLYALGHGRKPAAAIVAGVALGDLTRRSTGCWRRPLGGHSAGLACSAA